MTDFWLYQGDCVEVLRSWPEASVDAVVCDPPYEIGFMGRDWDQAGVAFSRATWEQVLRVLKPGGHLLAFGGTRTYHRMACAIEDAGFEIRDSIHWMYGSGFPKSLDVSKAIDKAAGAEREVVGPGPWNHVKGDNAKQHKSLIRPGGQHTVTAPATDAAREWSGWGTALKPAHEPVVLARKPLIGTVAENVLTYGTGGLNIDACRIGTSKNVPASPSKSDGTAGIYGQGIGPGSAQHSGFDPNVGRWPANVMFDEAAAAELDAQAEGVSRFFYVAKPSRRERDHGLEGFPAQSAGAATDREDGSAGLNSPRAGAGRTGGAKNVHPTVKPVALMRELCRLVTPPGGIVLDPFVGSGTTGMAARLEGFRFVGIDQSAEYLTLAHARIAAALTLK